MAGHQGTSVLTIGNFVKMRREEPKEVQLETFQSFDCNDI